MAARQLQRLRAQQEAPVQADAVESASEDERTPPAAGPRNVFALLTDEEGNNVHTEASESEHDEAAAPRPTPAVTTTKAPAANKKKKAKKKAREKQAAATPSLLAQPQEDDLDQLLRDIDMKEPRAAPAAPEQAGSAGPTLDGLLAVDVRGLRADEELRRIFGSRIVAADDRDEAAAGPPVGGNRRMRRALARGALHRRPLKRGLLITPPDHWPRFEGGIAMEALGAQRFRYTFSATYQAVQDLFAECQASFDPNNIIGLLGEYPYCVEALLTMHELYRATGQHEQADDMLGRALYALEMAWHPQFSPGAGTARLSHTEPANHAFFDALFRHIQGLSRRGLHGTALQCAKLLLGLDRTDPKGLLLAIDYFALRAQRPGFAQALARMWPSPLCMLPNFAYSLPLGRAREEAQRAERAAAAEARAARRGPARAPEARGSNLQGALSPSESPGKGTGATPVEELADAVLMFPGVVALLMEKLQEGGVGRDAEWRSLLARPLFADIPDEEPSASLSTLTGITVERQHLLWKAPDAQALLRAAVREATGPRGAARSQEQAARAAAAWPCGAPDGYAHLRRADFSDDRSTLPPEELQAMFGGGPHAHAVEMTQEELEALALAALERAQQHEDSNEETNGTGEETHWALQPLLAMLRYLMPRGDVEGHGENGSGPDGEAASVDNAEGSHQGQGLDDHSQSNGNEGGRGPGPNG